MGLHKNQIFFSVSCLILGENAAKTKKEFGSGRGKPALAAEYFHWKTNAFHMWIISGCIQTNNGLDQPNQLCLVGVNGLEIRAFRG